MWFPPEQGPPSPQRARGAGRRTVAHSARSAIIGSSPAARRAGANDASSDTAARSTDTLNRTAGSTGDTSNSSDPSHRVVAKAATRPAAMPMAVKPADRNRIPRITAPGLAPNRDPQPDLAAALRDKIRQHTVDAERDEQQRDGREHADQREHLLAIGQLDIDDVVHRPNRRHRLFGIDGPDGALERSRQRLRRTVVRTATSDG